MPNESEQWLLNGDCSKCRRNNYCSKACTRCKRKTKALMQSLVANAMNKATGGVMEEIIKQ